jgi:5-methylcytosine-specific restriction enzyme subunit McrC
VSSEIIRVHIREWESATPENRSELLGGKDFGFDEAARDLARRLTNTGRLEVTELARGLQIRAKSFVGRVQLGRWQITIQPKIPAAPLLNLLRYTYDLRRLDLFDPVGFALAGESFQDLLIHQLTAEAGELLARGLHRRYERLETVLTAPRGRIDFARYVSVVASARAALPCIDHPLTHDTQLNQQLLAGLRFARHLTQNSYLTGELGHLVKMLEPGVSASSCDQAKIEAVRRGLDRQTRSYTSALTLISMLLEARGIMTTPHAQTAHLSGFLFDMNRFFQALLSRFFREHLEGCEVSEEHQLKGMFRYAPRRNPLHKSAPTPRPDFVVLRPGKSAVVLDAKYRDLWTQPLPRAMLYQVALYALAQSGPAREAAIIYPTTDNSAQEQAIEFRDPMLGLRQATITLRPVSLLQLEALTHPAMHPQQLREARQFAGRLAFGSAIQRSIGSYGPMATVC